MGTLGTALERGGEHVVTLGPQALGHEFPDPSALIGTVDEHEVGHALTLPPLLSRARMAPRCPGAAAQFCPALSAILNDILAQHQSPALEQRAGMRENLSL